ncbi:MAG: LLM class flavin-dependent oxidoreductase [Alphaproteobacteria bacterium]|nr:LLM class flavin-dependent oxidoreductase [Alphaproteobacteria bacterium]
MKFGLFIANQWPAGTSPGPELLGYLEQVRVAKANGFHSLWIPQHFVLGPMQMFQPFPLIARLLAEAEGMRIGTGILLLSMLNPVMVAEEAATLDWFADGKLTLPVGIGYRPEEFQATGVPIKQRASRTVESIQVMRRLWTEERVTHKGRHFQLDNVGASIRPKQKGGIPIWLAGSAEAAVRRAAQLADAWLPSFGPSFDELRVLNAIYADARTAAKLPPPAVRPLCREVYVGTDNRTALDDVRGPLLAKYEAYASWGSDGVGTDMSTFAQAFDAFAKDRFIVGDQAFVKDEIQRYRDELGFDHMVLRCQWPGSDSKLAIRTIEWLAKISL